MIRVYLGVVLLHLRTKFYAAKFSMATVRHVGFGGGSLGTIHERPFLSFSYGVAHAPFACHAEACLTGWPNVQLQG